MASPRTRWTSLAAVAAALALIAVWVLQSPGNGGGDPAPDRNGSAVGSEALTQSDPRGDAARDADPRDSADDASARLRLPPPAMSNGRAAPSAADWQAAVDGVTSLVAEPEFVRSVVGRDATTEQDTTVQIDTVTAARFYEALVESAATASYQRPRDLAQRDAAASERDRLDLTERVTRTDVLFAVLPELCRRIAARQVDLQVLHRGAGAGGLGTTLSRASDGSVTALRFHVSRGGAVFTFSVGPAMVPAALWRAYVDVVRQRDRRR